MKVVDFVLLNEYKSIEMGQIMTRLESSLVVVTPMFAGDASPKLYSSLQQGEKDEKGRLTEQTKIGLRKTAIEPQLRSSSVRGALRWWLRVMLAGRDETLIKDTATLWSQEAEVFGSVDKASPIVVQVLQNDIETKVVDPSSSGAGYLQYGMDLGKDKDKGKERKYTPRKYYEENSSFTLILQTRTPTAEAEAALKQALTSLWLLMRLGGLGARSRRGLGSFVTTSAIPSLEGVPKFGPVGKPEALRARLREGLDTITGADWSLPPSNAVTPFPVLHPKYCQIAVVAGNPAWNSYGKVLDSIGLALSHFRSKNNKNLSMIAFGLPLSGITGYSSETKSNYARSASPLHIRITRLAQRKDESREYVVVLTLFQTSLLPIGATLSNGQPIPSQQAIIEFIKALKDNDAAMLGFDEIPEPKRPTFNVKMLWEPLP